MLRLSLLLSSATRRLAAGRPLSSSSPSPSPPLRLASQPVDTAARVLTLRCGDRRLRFPLAWLRDNCRCDTCYNPQTSDARRLLMNDFSPTLEAELVDIEQREQRLQIQWSDGHSSWYPLSWLQLRHFGDDGWQAAADGRLQKSAPTLWRRSPFRVEFFDFEAALGDDSELLRALLSLETHGLVLFDNCGTERSAVQRLCRRVAYPRHTHYGRTFVVEARDDPNNTAYTPDTLGFHTDLPYYAQQPEILILHCLKQTSTRPGGENGFSDGFSAAEMLREANEEQFRILADTLVDFRDKNSAEDVGQFYLVNRNPVLQLARGSREQVVRIHFSNEKRDSFLSQLPLSRVQLFYEALKAFVTLLHDPGHSLQLRLENGQLAMFDNGRLMHSRAAFKGARLYSGAYLSWDETLSRRRVLQRLE